MESYWTVIIPYVKRELATVWHPTDSAGPFSTLTRGSFKTEEEAVRWAREKLAGTPYSTRLVD